MDLTKQMLEFAEGVPASPAASGSK
jgi:hypothetical protein